MSRQRILIVTTKGDLHADIVSEKLAAAGAPAFRLNLDEFPRDFTIELTYRREKWCGRFLHQPSQDQIAAEDIGAIWVRKKADFTYASEFLPQEKAFADDEMEHLLFGLLYSLDCYWMSHPLAIRSAMWKLEQQSRAARMGFVVAPSILSNRPDAVTAFMRNWDDDIVFKTLSNASLGADKTAPEDQIANAIGTTRITQENLSAISAIADLPSFFQRRIQKNHELRITIIGDKVFTAKIHSQDDPRTMTDYRDYSAEIRYEATDLSKDLEQKCLDFIRSYGLAFGAIDVIVTPDNEYIFLENNPVGQFYFVEELAPELKMTDAVANQLIHGALATESLL